MAAILALLAAVAVSAMKLPSLLFTLIDAVLIVGCAGSSLIAVGGFVCLWRDARESKGKPDLFARFANRVPTQGLLSQSGLRFLLGDAPRPGDVVRVKTKAEIAATLDADGTLEGLPYMAEMDEFCGKSFLVYRRVDKINDMRHKTGLRRLRGVVILTDVRCSGAEHGGCQAECLILWKDAWLTRVSEYASERVDRRNRIAELARRGLTPGGDTDGQTYICQMTRLWEASQPMPPRDCRQDIRPLLHGNLPLAAYLLAFLTRLFNRVQQLRGGAGYPFMPDAPTPCVPIPATARFAPGQHVVVRRKEEIASTLVSGKNRGLWFDREMIRYCGQRFKVRRYVDRIIHEATGKMVTMKTPCLTLEGVIATGEFLRFCPQHEYAFWREDWLRPEAAASPNRTSLDS